MLYINFFKTVPTLHLSMSIAALLLLGQGRQAASELNFDVDGGRRPPAK